MATEFHINSIEGQYTLAGGYQALSYLCDDYIDGYFGYKPNDKKRDKIVTLYMLLKAVQQNQYNTDMDTDKTFQKAINLLYSEISTIPYQTRITGGLR